MSEDAKQNSDQAALAAKAKGVGHQHCSRELNGSDHGQFANEALTNSHEVMNTLAPPDAPPPPPKKPKA